MITLQTSTNLYAFLRGSPLSGHVTITFSEGEAECLLSAFTFVTPTGCPRQPGKLGHLWAFPSRL